LNTAILDIHGKKHEIDMPKVNPGILKWARETAGLSLEEAAHVIDLRAARGKSGAERLADLEKGTADPTRPQISAMAQHYRRPLVLFYLNEVPQSGERGVDFRTKVQSDRDTFEPKLDALIRDIRNRQSLVRSALEDDEAESLGFVGSAKIDQGHHVVAAEIIREIGFSLETFRASRTTGDAFRYLRRRIETSGIFVLLLGHLGGLHNKIPLDLYRGYAIADPIAPFIVINNNDAKAALAFTALHECAHIWLGTTGVSGIPNDSQVERFCNMVAATILLPEEEVELLELPDDKHSEELVALLSTLARKWRISRSMIAYRLYQLHRLTQSEWKSLDRTFQMQWETVQAQQKAEKTTKDGGPSPYTLYRSSVGDAVLHSTGRFLQEGYISPTDAAMILGVKPTQVQKTLFG